MGNSNPSVKKDESLLIDFCNVKKWDLSTILSLYEKYSIQKDSEDDLIQKEYKIRDCNTRHDSQHTYCLIENNRSKNLQNHSPETFVLPSQIEFQKLYEYLEQSQTKYRRFLDSCIKGNLDLADLNNLIRNINTSEPMFFDNPKQFSRKIKKREREFIKWNPVIYLMGNGKCIEDAIESEIIHRFLRREGNYFSKIRRCNYLACQKYFKAERATTAKYCPGDQCRYSYNNLMKKQTGYSKKYQANARKDPRKYSSPGYYIPIAQRNKRSS